MNQYSWGCYLYVYIGKATNNNLVVFDSNGGTEIENQEVAPGGKVTKPSDPTRTGCEFYGWFTDEALTQEFNFNTTVNSDLTLYAKYKGTVVARSYNNTTNSVFSGGYVGLGTHEPNNNYDEASVFCDDYIDLKANVNTGYNFIGWYENSPTGKLLSNNLTYNYKVLKDTDVYAVFEEKTLPTIEYSVQIKNEGWHAAVKNGETAMRNVSGNLQQAMRINIPDKPYEGSVEYRVHIENVGWQDWKKDGEIAGIEGTSLRTEALQIKLTGEMADHYYVYYRTHFQNNGWMSWAKNGEASGSSGAGLRIEGIQIKLTKKDAGEPAYNEYEPDKSYPFHEQVNVIYMGHIENKGDVGTNYLIRNGKTLGFPGQHLRMEGIKIYSESTTPGTIEYTTHVQNVGWLDEVDGAWSKSGEFCGRKGLGLRLEAIRIRLTDELADKYSVYYHVYSEKDGKWLDWAKDGDPAGSVGFSSKLEAIEIKVLVHGDPHEPTVGPNALVEAP